MIDKSYVAMMTRYNTWQNESLYRCAAEIGDAERRRDRGAFFGNIHATLNHLLWADQMWMHRFAGTPLPVSMQTTALYDDFDTLRGHRVAFDKTIRDWADALDPAWLDGDLTWHSAILKKDLSMPKQKLLVHLFNHQTHHRGQTHAMLTAAGAKPDDTDLMLMKG